MDCRNRAAFDDSFACLTLPIIEFARCTRRLAAEKTRQSELAETQAPAPDHLKTNIANSGSLCPLATVV